MSDELATALVFSGLREDEPEYVRLDDGNLLFVGDLPVWKVAEKGDRLIVVVLRADAP